MDLTERTVGKNYVYQGKIISVRNDDALLPDGAPCKREIVEHSGGACILYVKEGKILFIKQYRYAYGEVVLEIPAGKLNPGEDPSQAAYRELIEEAGVTAEKINLLHVVYPSPGYTNEKIYIYEAIGGASGDSHPDEDEFLEVEYIPFDKVKKMLASGEIKDGKTIIALQNYFLRH
ncbi:MAG: NUDIX hydrolase [Clostridia bacterium]|nr:NUDIX hydrolase [Clostridia bacterium]